MSFDLKKKFADSRKSLIEEPKEYELPDGRVVELGDEMKRCTEPLFSPGLVGNSSLGIPSLVQHTLERFVSSYH